jgi:hypothetical protein
MNDYISKHTPLPTQTSHTKGHLGQMYMPDSFSNNFFESYRILFEIIYTDSIIYALRDAV